MCVRVGGIRHEQQDSLITQSSQLVHIGEFTVHWVWVELEVGGMHHYADRRARHHADGVRDAMANVEKFHGEAT